ncbi:hypothetical protein BJ912DRAFT_87649 [Pholiota molesta]|nr:hypothetical protein BJ912DRAFT_87649 [Pholiota molesta]
MERSTRYDALHAADRRPERAWWALCSILYAPACSGFFLGVFVFCYTDSLLPRPAFRILFSSCFTAYGPLSTRISHENLPFSRPFSFHGVYLGWLKDIPSSSKNEFRVREWMSIHCVSTLSRSVSGIGCADERFPNSRNETAQISMARQLVLHFCLQESFYIPNRR